MMVHTQYLILQLMNITIQNMEQLLKQNMYLLEMDSLLSEKKNLIFLRLVSELVLMRY